MYPIATWTYALKKRREEREESNVSFNLFLVVSWFFFFFLKPYDCPALVQYLLNAYRVHAGCLSKLLLCCCKPLCTAEHTIHIHVNFAGRHLCLLKIAWWEKGSNTLYPNIHEGSACDWAWTRVSLLRSCFMWWSKHLSIITVGPTKETSEARVVNPSSHCFY